MLLLPNEIIIALTNDCNLDCTYCFQEKKEKVMMTKQTAKKIVDYISTIKGRVTVNFYGGEPLMNLEVFEEFGNLFTDARFKNGSTTEYYFYINSNGTIMNDRVIKTIKKLQAIGPFEFVVSLNGNEESHNKSRKTKNKNNTYFKIIENITYLKKEIPNLFINAHAVIDKVFVDDFYNNCKSMMDNKLFDVATTEFCYYGTDYEYSENDFIKMYSVINKLKSENYNLELIEKMFSVFFNVSNYKNIDKYNIMICEAGSTIICIDPNGNILPCDYYLGLKEYDQYVMCNINENTKNEIHYSEEWLRKYYKTNAKNILEYIKCENTEGKKCNECENKGLCLMCTACTECLSSIHKTPVGHCERIKNMANAMRKLKVNYDFRKEE